VLTCVTTAVTGQLIVTTTAGSVSAVYNKAVLQQSAIVTSVYATVWSTSNDTRLTITGTQYVR
jgi:hypothetical protein